MYQLTARELLNVNGGGITTFGPEHLAKIIRGAISLTKSVISLFR